MTASFSEIIEVPITPIMIENARFAADRYKDNLHNSIRNGAGTIVGHLGEEMVKVVYPLMTHSNTYDYDFLYGGLRIDVKTKDRKYDIDTSRYEELCFTQGGGWDCSVNKLNGVQEVDYYIFTTVFRSRATNEFTHGWILGTLTRDEFFKKARLETPSYKDSSNGFVPHCDTYQVKIQQLDKPRK